jgi:hypothetical protein
LDLVDQALVRGNRDGKLSVQRDEVALAAKK